MSNIEWVLDPGKFLSRGEVKKLLFTAESRAKNALARGNKVAVRDYFIISLALSTGLRVGEIAELNCGDFIVKPNLLSVIVRKGKGNRKRLVRFGTSLARHFQQYMAWKEKAGESTEPQACVFLSSNTGRHMTRRAIQKVFKKAALRAGLPEHYSIHCCRHTYACELYRASGYNLRLVQKQLGHSNSRITEVYADIFHPDTEKSLEKLYK